MQRPPVPDSRSRTLASWLFLLAFAVAPAGADPVETRLLASDGAFGDRFGSGVALEGDFALIGAQADDDLGGDAGAAYIFDAAGAAEIGKIHAADGAAGDYFGASVAVWGDRAVIGALRDDHVATDAGSAYLFDFPTGTQLHKLTAADAAADDWFGNSVAISASYALVGAYKNNAGGSITDSGAAYLFDVATGTQVRKLTAADAGNSDLYGYSVAVSDQYAVVGAIAWDGIGRTDCGAVYVYDVATGAELWRLTTADQGPYSRFGNAVALEGDYLLAGAYWDENEAGSNAGAAYVFDLTTGLQVFELRPTEPEGGGDWFGTSVALAGGFAIIGACQQGYGTELQGFACVFDIRSGLELWKLTASDGGLGDNFGFSAAIEGPRVLVGADKNDDDGVNSGSAYLYEPVYDLSGMGDGDQARALELRSEPSPFSPSTEIRFALPRAAAVRLEVFDAGGRRVRTLLDGDVQGAGAVRVLWRGEDESGRPVPDGIYFYEMEAEGRVASGRVSRLR